MAKIHYLGGAPGEETSRLLLDTSSFQDLSAWASTASLWVHTCLCRDRPETALQESLSFYNMAVGFMNEKREPGSILALVSACAVRSDVEEHFGNSSHSLDYTEYALDLLEQAEREKILYDPQSRSRLQADLALVLARYGRYEEALENASLAVVQQKAYCSLLKESQKQGEPCLLAGAQQALHGRAHILGLLYMETGQSGKGLELLDGSSPILVRAILAAAEQASGPPRSILYTQAAEVSLNHMNALAWSGLIEPAEACLSQIHDIHNASPLRTSLYRETLLASLYLALRKEDLPLAQEASEQIKRLEEVLRTDSPLQTARKETLLAAHALLRKDSDVPERQKVESAKARAETALTVLESSLGPGSPASSGPLALLIACALRKKNGKRARELQRRLDMQRWADNSRGNPFILPPCPVERLLSSYGIDVSTPSVQLQAVLPTNVVPLAPRRGLPRKENSAPIP